MLHACEDGLTVTPAFSHRALVNAYKLQPTLGVQQVGISLFFMVVDYVSEETQRHPPTRQFFTSCIDILGQVSLFCVLGLVQIRRGPTGFPLNIVSTDFRLKFCGLCKSVSLGIGAFLRCWHRSSLLRLESVHIEDLRRCLILSYIVSAVLKFVIIYKIFSSSLFYLILSVAMKG